MSALLWLLVALPLAAGSALATGGRRVDRAAPAVGVTTAGVSLALAAAVTVGRPAVQAPLFLGIPAGLAVDALSAIMVVTVTAVTLAVLVYSAGEFGPEEARGRFFGIMLVFAGAMLVTVTATNLAILLIAWEVMGAASYALIGHWWREPRRVGAADTAFVTTRAADLGLYLAAGAALAGGVGTLALDRLPAAGSPWLTVITVGVVLAALGKSAQLPFSFWLSRAMEGPSPVSALLHSAAMVAAGAYLLLRLQPLLAASGWGASVVAWVGAVTALALGLVAVAQRDLKQLLAASTCAQIGFMVLAAGVGGVAGGAEHLVAHAATKALLFLAAGAWLTALGTKDLDALRGAARRYRLTGAAFAVGALALAGIPPLSLWVTKDEVLASALHDSPALYGVGLAAAVVAAVYSVKVLARVLRPAPEAAGEAYDTERRGTRRVTGLMRAPLPALAGLAAVLGVLAVLAVPAISQSLARALGDAAAPSPTPWELGLSAGLALAAAALTWRWGTRPAPLPAAVTGWLGRWMELEGFTHRLVVAPTLALARTLARLDDCMIDGGVRVVAEGTRRLGALARRPQTGQLHQYYAQAVALLVLLAVVFVLVR